MREELKRRRLAYTWKLMLLVFLTVGAGVMYQFINVRMKYFDMIMKLRAPNLVVIIIVAFCIGCATIIFQTLINNTIVTPCLLGMNSLYILVHTMVVFLLGTSSIYVKNNQVAFIVDLVIMTVVAMILYGYLFQKTGGNILYILLAGTVMATLFTSITSTVQRMMSPNDFATLETTLIASFSNVNTKIIGIAVILIAIVLVLFRKDIRQLDVISLGRNQAINLGVDYDRVLRRLLIAVTILISIATAMVGPISFLGLIIANIGRQLFKTYKHSILILGTTLIGAVMLLAGQSVIEHVLTYSATISTFITIGGGAYFLFLIMRDK